ncbi:MAG: hypothetical protein ABJX32_04315 [Tateyamaria sp.]|uniref:ATP-binding cassette domain-containing protein n=1 Tax=Tateyamaria sp. TaxID=1929288 RepID=UPI0032A0BDA4
MKSLKTWLKKETKARIGSLGYELRREYNPDSLKKFSRKRSAGKVLEFIGPSGIGKSTLLYAIRGELSKDWFLPHHAASLFHVAFKETDNSFDSHRQLLLNRVARIDRNQRDFWTLATSVRYGAQVASTDIAIRSDFPRGFVLDEGLFQIFSGDFSELDKGALEKLCAGRSLVFLSAHRPETIAERRMARNGRRHSGADRSREDVSGQSARAEISLQHFSSFADKMRDLGADVLTLFAEDENALNLEKVLDFSKRICRSD